MSTLKHNPLNHMFNAAVQTICKRVWPQGFDTSETNAPGTFKALKEEYDRRGRITVYSGASDKTIFDDHGINVMFLAWHDHAHLRAGGKYKAYVYDQRAFVEYYLEHGREAALGRTW